MMRRSLLALSVICFSGSAMAAQSPAAITVQAPDPFAAVAIQQGDLARAETLLTSRRLGRSDPIRLLNLGAVYWLSGRHTEAVAAWQSALASPVQYDVQTAGGRMRSTDELAREALAAAAHRPVRTASR